MSRARKTATKPVPRPVAKPLTTPVVKPVARPVTTDDDVCYIVYTDAKTGKEKRIKRDDYERKVSDGTL